MKTLVLYDSTFGNTAQIAAAIARGAAEHGTVTVKRAADVTDPLAEQPNLVVVGGPTERHGMSSGLRAFIDGLAAGSLRDVHAVTFDTRYRMATLLSGSAAKDAAGRLRRSACWLIAPPESFFVTRNGSPKNTTLEPGELVRAENWGRVMASVSHKV